MFPLASARKVYRRWFMGSATSAGPKSPASQETPAQIAERERAQRIGAFLLETKEADGTTRLIRFDSVRERLGETWPKLHQKVELLAEKIISAELLAGDRYVGIGQAEFLIFFSEAPTPEIRLRCVSLVETIYEKLFGLQDQASRDALKLVEFDALTAKDLAPWRAGGAEAPGRSAELLRRQFMASSRVVDHSDIIDSAQAGIDSIIASAIGSSSPAELAALAERVARMSRNLETLGALVAPSRDQLTAEQALSERGGQLEPAGIERSFLDATSDTTELAGLLVNAGARPHGDILAALMKLRHERAEKAAREVAGEDNVVVPDFDGLGAELEYAPVYRSVRAGQNIYRGIFRADIRRKLVEGEESYAKCRPARERSVLQQAIRYSMVDGLNGRFMLMLPIDIETLRSPPLVRQYSAILRSADPRIKQRLIVEVTGYCALDNTIAIRRAMDDLRAQFHGIFMTIRSDEISNVQQIATDCKKMGAHALGLDASKLIPEAALSAALAKLAMAGQRASMHTYVAGISSAVLLVDALYHGIHYFCVPDLSPPRATPENVGKVELPEILSAS